MELFDKQDKDEEFRESDEIMLENVCEMLNDSSEGKLARKRCEVCSLQRAATAFCSIEEVISLPSIAAEERVEGITSLFENCDANSSATSDSGDFRLRDSLVGFGEDGGDDDKEDEG